MTRRQHMILAWALVCLGNGVYYTPIRSGYGDFPAALETIVDTGHVWVFGVLWLIGSVLGLLSVRWHRWEAAFWPAFLGLMCAWGGLYLGGAWSGVSPNTWKGAALYFCVAYAAWASKGSAPPNHNAEATARNRPLAGDG